ncbi:hypothetical protein [Phocaeicola barnesiae]|uniref:hypothetical protein n=1 Tax=Phocaeicola barnesiae TaxID=376804 RepID=UPI00241E8EED|nr:hypothetical protein [Phocaeicola barnesiae]
MKLRTVAKFAVILSTLLFCVGVGVYSFVQLKLADKTQTVDLLELVPADSRGLLETDNVDFFISELPRMAYAAQFDTLHQSNLIETIFYELTQYTSHAAHGLSNQVNQLMLSFHFPGNPRDMVAYFRMSKEGKDLFKEVLREKYGDRFTPKKEIYRGKEIQVYPLDAEDFLSLYGGKGFLVASHEKRLIEQVIDAQLDKRSLSRDTVLASLRHNKSSRFMTFYGRTASVPLLTGKRDYCWSEFDLHMNSEVIYLNGSMAAHNLYACHGRTSGRYTAGSEGQPAHPFGNRTYRFLHQPGFGGSGRHPLQSVYRQSLAFGLVHHGGRHAGGGPQQRILQALSAAVHQ